MSRIVLIGYTGQLASDIQELLQKEHEIIGLDLPDFNVADKDLVVNVLTQHNPDYVINTSAFHNVASCEQDPQKAFLINSTALQYLSDTCKKLDAVLFHFSSDYVYGVDENRTTPYIESDIAGPVNIYGVSKLAGEKILEYNSNKYFCLRISGLYGIKGTIAKKYPNFVEMMITLGKQAEEKGERMPSAMDQILTFNPTIEIAKVVQKLMKKEAYGLYHATCEGYCSRVDFVKEIFKLEGITTEVYGVTSDYFKPTYRQPKFSALENSKLKKLNIEMPFWKDALKNYLKTRNEK